MKLICDSMEMLNIDDCWEIQSSKVVKKVPILSEQLVVSTLCLNSNTSVPAHKHERLDELVYVIKGAGEITIGNKSEQISEGMLVLIPREKPHCVSTSEKQLMILSIKSIVSHQKKSNKKQGEVKGPA